MTRKSKTTRNEFIGNLSFNNRPCSSKDDVEHGGPFTFKQGERGLYFNLVGNLKPKDRFSKVAYKTAINKQFERFFKPILEEFLCPFCNHRGSYHVYATKDNLIFICSGDVQVEHDVISPLNFFALAINQGLTLTQDSIIYDTKERINSISPESDSENEFNNVKSKNSNRFSPTLQFSDDFSDSDPSNDESESRAPNSEVAHTFTTQVCEKLDQVQSSNDTLAARMLRIEDILTTYCTNSAPSLPPYQPSPPTTVQMGSLIDSDLSTLDGSASTSPSHGPIPTVSIDNLQISEDEESEPDDTRDVTRATSPSTITNGTTTPSTELSFEEESIQSHEVTTEVTFIQLDFEPGFYFEFCTEASQFIDLDITDASLLKRARQARYKLASAPRDAYNAKPWKLAAVILGGVSSQPLKDVKNFLKSINVQVNTTAHLWFLSSGYLEVIMPQAYLKEFLFTVSSENSPTVGYHRHHWCPLTYNIINLKR